ncbi:MAG TPA: DUF1194 domain-containing protein [Beijerinckiaceae bacterium]|nr:DUF1194 domain-containing protein [Beijerinckiaceae bacterium]
MVRALGLLALVLALFAGPREARAGEVDLALVLAVDISYSMDLDELALQREGFAAAFRSREVKDAIGRGMLGRIAVAYLEWAGAGEQRVSVPWTVIDGPAAADAFADKVAAVPVRRARRTSISGAIDASVRLLEASPHEAARKVIDVSGDGPNNEGRPVTLARDAALAQGITINGLPLQLKEPGWLDLEELDVYYRDCVIGGPGAFMVPARSKAEFQQAIKTKIILEIAGVPVPGIGGDALAPVPAQERRTNCMIGEIQWRDRMGN